MKRIKSIIALVLLLFVLVGCEQLVINEIHNKSYHVDVDIETLNELFPAIIERAAPAVLGVSNYVRDENVPLQYSIGSVGSGVVYFCEAILASESEEEVIESDCSLTLNSTNVVNYRYRMLTNRHVVDNADRLKVYFGEEDVEVDATLLGADDKVDLAILQFMSPKYIQPLDFADSNELKRGNIVVALGNPSGYEYYGSATMGIVSSPKRYLSDDTDGDDVADWDSEYIQHDASINPGNSGGALINVRGELIGINTLKLVSSDIDNMGFAIPVNVIIDLIPFLEQGIVPQRAKLGVVGMEVATALMSGSYDVPAGVTHGLIITEVGEGIAQTAGVLVDDIIVEFNGVVIKRTHELRAELGKFLIGSGDEVLMKVFREGEVVELTIIF